MRVLGVRAQVAGEVESGAGTQRGAGEVKRAAQTRHIRDRIDALDAPRWRYDGGLAVAVEAHAPREVLDGLARRGHEVTVMEPTFNHGFGRGQIIRRLDNGAYVAGSEPRSDGCAAGW